MISASSDRSPRMNCSALRGAAHRAISWPPPPMHTCMRVSGIKSRQVGRLWRSRCRSVCGRPAAYQAGSRSPLPETCGREAGWCGVCWAQAGIRVFCNRATLPAPLKEAAGLVCASMAWCQHSCSTALGLPGNESGKHPGPGAVLHGQGAWTASSSAPGVAFVARHRPRVVRPVAHDLQAPAARAPVSARDALPAQARAQGPGQGAATWGAAARAGRWKPGGTCLASYGGSQVEIGAHGV
jgi:hypothetical protein